MSSEAALRIVERGALDGRLTHVRHFEEREARWAAWPQWADPDVIQGYRALGVGRPWEHQVAAAESLWSGRHTVVSTGTGSGKSLPAWLSAISAIRADDVTRATPSSGSIAQYRRRPTVLYLSPTKALAADQLTGLTRLLDASRIGSVRVGTCDGDTPFSQRDWVREHADIVLTNPDFLHITLLPGHRYWERLLRGLTYVVVDEMHAYRGVMGAHVAHVLRRLLRLARGLGAEPTVYVASATTADPVATTARLIGTPEVTAVAESGAPQGARTIALWQGASKGWLGPAKPTVAEDDPWGVGAAGGDDPWGAARESALDGGPRRAATSEAAHLLADFMEEGVRSLAFVRARASAEYVADRTREILDERGSETVGAVGSYRGGYLPEERREIEAALRSGEILGLATTNALELGIDVSGLDAVLIAGWPGSRASLWQQSGRAGRAGQEGVAVFIASSDPLDTYLVHHPDALFGDVEATVFDPDNPYVLAPHLCAAAAEAPIKEADLALFGPACEDTLERLVAMDLLKHRPTGWYWNLAKGPHPYLLTDLRGAGGEVQVVEAATGAILGTVNAGTADAAVHPGATYIHRGEVFVVEDLADDVALVRRGDPGYRTRSQGMSSVQVIERERSEQWGPVLWELGTVEVTEQVVGYDRLLPPAMEIVGHYALEMPERVLRTTAVWWSLPEEATGVDRSILGGSLHAAEHASIGVLPLHATCDRWDIGGLSIADHPDTGAPTVFVYDGYPGGAGFAERGFEKAREWLAAALAVIEECPCEDGCPACVQSPKCGSNNSPLSKSGAATVLRAVLAGARRVA
ncbi:DEAD/DEAH box helicase domain-containing protein [Ruaniaceae bacterium KH17]|nr:DEAD/DEAH box helicase domain-containing protein [Ruaniaceae bacterium KH17]